MEENFKCCCFTGYRPSKFPFPLDKSSAEYIEFENRLTNIIFSLTEDGCYTFMSGLAMGFDIIAAETVLLLKKAYKKASITLMCAVPFIEQSSGFTDEWKERYNAVLEKADKTVLISDKYFKGCYDRRNKFMVDRSDYVVTWFDGRAGGTKNTVEYAEKTGKTVINLYDRKII